MFGLNFWSKKSAMCSDPHLNNYSVVSGLLHPRNRFRDKSMH